LVVEISHAPGDHISRAVGSTRLAHLRLSPQKSAAFNS
jgi:hypothetical protein